MKNRAYWQLLPYIQPQLATIAAALGCTAIFTVFWPILVWLAQRMAASISAGEVKAIATLAAVAAVVFLLRGAAQYGQDALMAKAALAIALQLRRDVYAHLQRLSLTFFTSAKTGDLAYRLTEDIDRLGEVINQFFHDFIPCILQLIVLLGYMLYLNWQLTLATLIVTPIMGLLIGLFGNKLLHSARKSQEKIANLSALLTEVFNGIKTVQLFAAEEYEIARFMEEAEQNRRAKYTAEKIKAFQFFVVGFLYAMSAVFIFFIGGWQIAQNNLTGSGFIGFIAAVALLIDPVVHITNNYNQFQQGQASLDRVFELFSLSSSSIEQLGGKVYKIVDGRVTYDRVSFAYIQDQPVLKEVSFETLAGEKIALVGASGAGKSTLIDLLLRFYPPQQGKILIDGVDIQQIKLKTLRQQIGVVSQEISLFSGTIAQNIAFGQVKFDLEQVQAAAKIANADGFIRQLSQGYWTYLGERGVNLSGGQKQRIAIARAIYLNPRILILDEATSALDSESEALVEQALGRIVEGRTVLIIAHRLATVRQADRILVIEKGRIIESGSHQQLLAQAGRYAQFYTKQFQQS